MQMYCMLAYCQLTSHLSKLAHFSDIYLFIFLFFSLWDGRTPRYISEWTCLLWIVMISDYPRIIRTQMILTDIKEWMLSGISEEKVYAQEVTVFIHY